MTFEIREAAAANKAWAGLLESEMPEKETDSADFVQALQTTREISTECFTNLLLQIEELDYPPSQDSYAWETMSESLVRQAISENICVPVT
jgi:phosphatidylinositol 4-kinase